MVGQGVHTVKTLGEAGLIRPQRPDRTVRALIAMQRWGFTPAADTPQTPRATRTTTRSSTSSGGCRSPRSTSAPTAWPPPGWTTAWGRATIAVMCRNHRGFIETTVAASKLGMTCLYMNTARGSAADRGRAAREARRDRVRRGVLRAARGCRQAPQALRRLARLGARRPARRDARERDRARRSAGPVPPAESGKAIILTSGTTGTPKGASRKQPETIGPRSRSCRAFRSSRARRRSSSPRCSTPGASRTSRSA